MTQYGYARVSTRDQNVNRQLDALREFPVLPEHTYVDYYTGASFERPRYQDLMDALSPGDILVVTSIDRLGRNYEEILDQWRHLTRTRGVDIVVLDMPLLDTRATGEERGVTGVFISDLVLQILSYVAQVERENIHRRQAEGIAAAQLRGTKFGRPLKKRPRNYEKTVRSYELGEVSKSKAAAALGVSRATFDKWLSQDREQLEDLRGTMEKEPSPGDELPIKTQARKHLLT